MAITHGMDAGAVEELAVFLQQRASRLRSIAREINARVYSSIWDGEEARMFNQQLWPRHRARLLAAADRLDGLAQSARNNAHEQLDASGASGPGSAGQPVGGGRSTGGAWARLGVLGDPESVVGLAAVGVLLASAPSAVRRGSQIGRLIDARWAMQAGGAAARSRVGGLTSALKQGNEFDATAKIGTAIGSAQFALVLHDHGWGDARTWDAGVNLIGSTIAGRVPGGDLAWAGSYGVGHELPKAGDAVVHHFTGMSQTAVLYSAAYEGTEMSAAEITARTQKPWLLGWDLTRGAVKGLF